MAANSIIIWTAGQDYDFIAEKYFIDTRSASDDPAYEGSYVDTRTYFSAAEPIVTVNLRIINDQKSLQNSSRGAGLTALSPAKLIGGLV